ncbi:MAG: peptidyl-prolyl cis-trans isomerase [Planctomycetes bacterium]|nr:peptidyl-prolyl cis-trans isomerase [Planctomycetota bacterium]
MAARRWRTALLGFVAAVTAGGALAGQDGANSPAAGARPIDANFVVAAANNEVVTVRDVLLEWRLEGRRNADPNRAALPNPEERKVLAKRIVVERLWLAHAKAFPAWSEIVTRKLVEDEARDLYGALWSDPALPAAEHELMRAKAERSIATQVALQSDPEFRRVSLARPSDVRRFWEQRPDLHRVPTRVQLGRVVLGRELHGSDVEAKVAALRQLAIEKGGLETAARELAPGDYSLLTVENLEGDRNLREDVLQFAREAQPGELSLPIVGSASAMLFTVVTREPGREVSFDEAAAKLKLVMENGRRDFRARQFFVFEILPKSFFIPSDLFDEEIRQLIPGYQPQR